MLTKLLLLFILVPALELILLIQIGQAIGSLLTVALIVTTGILGAFLARRQGLQVLSQMRGELSAGRLPADAISDGVIILIAGAFLMTPGILTDTLGFLCLVPITRRMMKSLLWSRAKRAMGEGRIFTTFSREKRQQDEPEDVIILDPDDYK